MSIVVTHSDIKNFLTCKRLWYWSYVSDYKKPERLVGALATGTRVHASIEHYYKTGEDPIAEHDRLAAADIATLEAEGAGWELDDLYDDIIIGRNCVRAHQEWLAKDGADGQYEVVSVERTIEAEFIPGVILRCKADVLFRDIDTGFLVVNDLKTDGSWTGGTREVLERSWQAPTYDIITGLAYPDEIIGGAHYTVMKKMKRPERSTKPLVERWPVPGLVRGRPARRALLEQICRDMLETMERVEAEGTRHAYPSPNPSCRWCEFKNPCDLVDESPLGARAMLDDQYIRGGRHARYDPK